MSLAELGKREFNKDHGVRHPTLGAKPLRYLGDVRLPITAEPDLSRRRVESRHSMARPVVNADLVVYDGGVGRRRSTRACTHVRCRGNAEELGSIATPSVRPIRESSDRRPSHVKMNRLVGDLRASLDD